MDAAYLQLIVSELQRTLCGATVTHVSARDQRTVLLGLRVRGTRRDLLASANPSFTMNGIPRCSRLTYLTR